MFSNIISDNTTPMFASTGIKTPYLPSVQSLYETGMIPGNPTADVQSIDPIPGMLSDFAAAGQSRDASMRSDTFNWDKSGAAQYVNDRHFATMGFNPFAGNITDPTAGKSVNPYEIRYNQASDWGDVLSKGAGQFAGLALLTAKSAWQSDVHLWNAISNSSSWTDLFSGNTDTFVSKLAGSPEELMETDKELKDIMNKYHIFQTPETQEGIFNKEFFGDIVGQLGFSVGAAGYMLGTGLLMGGLGRIAGASKNIAALTRLGKAMEQLKDAGHLDDLKNVENLINSGKTATKIAEDVNMVKKMTDLGKNRAFIQGVVENFTPFYQAITDAKAVKTAGGTGWNMLQASVPGLIKNYTMFSAARAEASVEAAGTYGDLYIGLMDSFYEKEGRMPDATEAMNIKNAAYGAATDNFIVNTGLLMTMNSIQFGNMLSKFSSTKRLFRELAEASDDGFMAVKGTLKDGTKDVYKVYNKNAFGGIGAYNKVRKDFGLGTAMYTILKNNAKNVGKWEVSEGLQELLQEGSNKSLTEYYTNMYHGNKDVDGNILNRVDLAKGLGDQLNKEGWKTFLMGSVTGLFMSPLTSAVMYGKTAGAKALNSNVREAAENKKKTVETNRQLLETFFNNPDTATKGFSRFKEQMKVSKNIGDAVATNDPYMSHNSKDDAISQAAGAAVKAGMLDAFVDNIRMMGDGRFTPEEFMQQFNLTEKVDPKQYADQLADNIEQYYVNWQNLKDRYADLVMPELERDPAKQLDAIWKKAALNEAIEIMAYNSYHAESAMKRAAEVKTAAGQIPGIGQATSRVFDLFGNNSELDKEVKLLKTNLKTLQGTAEGDPELQEQVKVTEDRIKYLEQWKEEYNKLLDSKEESEEMDILKKKLQFTMRAYIMGDNIAAGRSNTNLLDADFEKAFKLLGDYNAVNRDYSQYIEIQNLLSNPKNFVTLHSKLFDSMMAAKDIVKEEAKKEADLRADITNGDPVPEDITKDDTDDDDFADSDVLPVDIYTPVPDTVTEETPEQATTVTSTPAAPIKNQEDKDKIQNINNMNILTLKGTPEQIAAKDAVLRDTTPEELRAGLRIVARRSVDDIERVELPDGKIQLLDKRVTTTVKDLGTFPEDDEDAIQSAIKQAMMPFKKGDYVQQMRSTYTVAVYYRDTLIGYLQPRQQYLFTFNGQLVDVGSLTIEQFKATALIPKNMPAAEALTQFQNNVQNSLDVWSTLEPLLAAGNMELSGEEIPMKIVPSPGERDFNREKDSIETVRPTLAEVQEQYEIEGIIDSSANEVFYGNTSLLEQQPVYAGNLGNYRVAVKLPNGQRVWVQAKGIKMTDEYITKVAERITTFFNKKKKTEKDTETLNKLLATVFITTRPEDGNGIFFSLRISKNGNLALRWYDPFRGANGASGVIDVIRNEVPFTDMDSFTAYLTDVINVAMKSDAAVKKGVMWPEGGVTFTEYNVRKQPNVDALDQMEITSNIGLVKNIGASVIPAAAVPIRNRIEAPIVQENIPEEPAVEGNSSVTVSVAVAQDVNNTQAAVESLNNIEDADDLLAAMRALKTVPTDEVFTGQSIENIGRFSDYIKKNLPSWLTLEEVDSFIDTLYNNNITVGEFMYYLDKTGNVQAVIRTNKDSVGKYHEAFHMVFRLLLPQDTIDRLLSEVAGVYAATPERLQTLRESSPIYTEMSEEQLTEALYEEYMADAFDAFRMGRTERVTTGIRGFFNKLTDWINWLWAQFTGADMKGLFYEIESGSFNNSTVQSNQFIKNIGTSANIAKKVIPIGTDIIQTPSGPKEVTKYLPQQEGEIISSTMAALFLKKALLEGSYNTNAVYKEILDTYAAMYNPNDPKYDDRFKAMMRVDKEAAIRWFLRLKERYTLFSSDAGRDALKDAANVYLKIAGIKTDMEEDETEDLTDDYGERNVEDRKRPTTYAALSSFLRQFIGGTTVAYTDEFGNIEFSAGVPLVQSINANQVYNGMIKLLSNQSEGVDMVSRMWSMRNDDSNPETAAFIRELIKETGLEYNQETNTFVTAKNSILIQQVIKGFNMFELDHLFVQMDTDNKVRVFSANSQEVAQNQLNAWNADYETRLGNKLIGKTKADIKSTVTAATQGLDGFLATMNTKQALATHLTTPELKDLSKQLSNSIYAGTGIKLSPRYIEYSIAVAKNEDVRTREQRILINGYTDVEPLTAEDVRGIKYSLLKGDNIFMETADNLGAIGRLKTMALGNAQFDESVNTMSYQTADGETVYSHTLPSWITVTTNKLNNSRHLEELMQDPDRRSFLLESERFLEQARQRKIKVIGADGLKRVDTFEPGATVDDTGRAITNTDGKVMGDFTGREFLIYLFSTYIKPKNVVTAQSPIEKRTDEDGDTYATESFTTAPVMLRTIEAKNQMFFMELPIVAAVENNRLSQQVLDIMYDMVLQEQQRIARVKEEIETIVDQATRPLDTNEVRVEVKEGYHTGKKNDDGTWKTWPRGLKLFNAALMVGDMAADIEAGKPIDREMLNEQLNRYWLAETEALITDMRVLGMIRKESDGSIKNLLAPEYLFKGAQGQAGEYNLEKGNFFHNVMQVFVNDYVNSAAANRLLLGEEAMSFKNTIDQVKRASGWAAAGPDMRVLVTAPEWGINHTLNTFHHFTFADPRFRKMSDGVDKDGKLEATGDKADAQMYMTEKALRYALFGFGTLNKTQVEALNTLADGNQLSKEAMFGEDGLKKAGAFNSMKLVYFDGQNYLKNSTIALFKSFTSLPDSSGEYTIPFPGREHLHELRLKMEEFEAKSATIVFGHPVTASKGMKVDIASTVSAVTDSSFQQLDAQYMRKQVENPSNKIEITAPTQAMIQIMAEQNPDTKVVFLGSEKDSDGNDWTVGRILKIYQESIAQRKTNSFNTAVNDIVNYEDGLVELQTSIDIGKLSPKQGQFIKHAQEMLMATGASSQELGFFELDKNGDPIYDMNFPAVLTKYTQLFLSYFSKGILSEKVPGMSVATVSPWGIRKIKVVKSIWKEGDKGYKKALEGQPRTWKVVTDAEIRANPAAYSNAIDWSTQDEYARRYEGLQVGDIIVDDLRHNYPKYDENGNYLGQFSECLIPAHYKDVMDKIPEALRFMFGIRIPSDDKHSYVALEYVDTLPAQYGSVGVFPQEIIEISGMDFDIDKMYIEMAATYLVGDTRVPYGTAVTEEEKMLEWLTWQLDNKTPLKTLLASKIDSDPEIKELRREIKDLLRYREDLQQQWADTELFMRDIISKSVQTEIRGEQADVKAQRQVAEQQLIDLRNYYLGESLKELGLPTDLDSFNKKGGEKLNNGVLTNRALSAKLAMLNNDDIALDTEEQLSILNQGTSVDILTDLVKELAAEFASMSSNENVLAASKKNVDRVLRLLQEPDVNVDSMRGKLASNMNNKEGSRNIGAAVLSMLVFSTLNQHNMTLSSKDYQLSFNNQDYLSFINTKTTDGARKFAQISAIVNAMTDNAKERLAAKLGLNIEAVGYVSAMVSLGVPIKTATLMMLQPIVRTYFKQLQATKGAVKTDEEKKIRASTLLTNMIDSVKNIGGVEITDSNMVSNIAGGDNNTAVSASAIRMLYKVDQVSQNIAQIAKVTRLQKGLPKTWEEIGSILTAVASLSDPMVPASIPFYDVIYTDPIMSTNIRILQQIDSIAPAFFTEKTTAFKNITDIIHANFEPERMADRDRYTATVKNDLLSFLAIKAYMHNMATKPEVIDSLRHSLIYPTAGQQTIVDIVKELRELISTEGSGRNRKNLMIHKFLNAVDTKITETGIDELRVNNWTKLSEGYIESLAGAFVDLYSNSITDKNNKPLNTHTQAIAIFNYLLVKDGGQFKNNSFIRYIPPFVFMDLLSSSKKVNEMMKLGYRATEEDYMRVFGDSLGNVRKQFVDSYGMHTNNFYNIKKVSGVQGAVTVNSIGIKINTTAPPAVRLETIGGFSYTTDINEATGAKVVVYMLPYYVKILDKLYKLSTVDDAAVSTGSSTPIQTGTTAEYTLVYGGSRGSKSTSIMTGVFGELPMRPGIQPATTQGQSEAAPVPTAVDLKDKGTPIKRVIGDRYVNEYADGTVVEVENDGSRDIPDAYYDIFADPAANDSFVPQEEFSAPFEEDSTVSAQPVVSSQPMEPVQQPIAVEQGRYVTYNEDTYIVTQQNSNGTWQIYDPTKEGTAAKKSVAEKNLTPTTNKASIVEYKGKEYIVTPKQTIISLTTNKKMEWGPENGDRNAILSMIQPTAVQQSIQFKEHPLADYPSRTRENASADVTIALAVDFNSAGEKLTKNSVTQQGKMYIPIDLNKGLAVTPERVDKIVDMLNRIGKPEITMNIAGNGIYTMAGQYTQPQLDEFMYQLLSAVLQSPNLKTKIVAGRTGGQTGMDEAGAKAMSRLGIPTTVLAPKGWKMRGIDGKDVSGATEFQKRFLPAGSPLPGSVWKTELAAIYKEKGDKKGRTELEWTNAAIRFRDKERSEGTTDQQILDTIKCIK